MLPFFLHIPKTAGSSVRTLITRNYAADQVLSLEGKNILWQARSRVGKTGDLRLVQGHIPHGLHWVFGLRAAEYFVFLRDPVARHFSELAHALRDSSHGYHTVASSCSTPMALARVGDQAIYFRNTNTQYLSGNWFIGEVGWGQLQLAIKNVLECRFVGLAERFDESVLMMARHLNWRHVTYERHNVTRATEKVAYTPEMAAECSKWLTFDLDLYQIACDRFENDVRQHGSHLQEAAAQLRELSLRQASEHPEVEHGFYQVGDPLTVAEILERQIPAGSPLWQWMQSY